MTMMLTTVTMVTNHDDEYEYDYYVPSDCIFSI